MGAPRENLIMLLACDSETKRTGTAAQLLLFSACRAVQKFSMLFDFIFIIIVGTPQ